MCTTCHAPILTTHNAICISAGGIGPLHRNGRAVWGVARHTRHTTCTGPYAPWALYVPPCREGIGAVTKEGPSERRQRTENRRKARQTHIAIDTTYVRIRRRRIDANTHKHTTYSPILTDAPMSANAATADGSDLGWRPHFGKVQRATLNGAYKAVRRFYKTESGHLKVVMKIRPAREINIKQLEVHLTRLGLAFGADV